MRWSLGWSRPKKPVCGWRPDGGFVNKVEHTLRTGQGVLQLGHNAGNIIERLGVLVGIVQQNRKLADRNAAANGNQRAHHADRRIHQRVDKAGGRVGDGGKEGGLYAADLQIGVNQFETLLGVTGSGKTFTMANVIAQLNKPTLVLAHNKTLVAQLYGEFKEFFPENAVEYFVS